MAIQNRRGAYTDFDPSKMLPGEYAIVLSGDPSDEDGYAVYMCFASGTVKRLVLSEQLEAAISSIMEDLQYDSVPTANSPNLLTSGTIKTALDGKQNTLTFDSTPTANSSNPVTSAGIKTALDNIMSNLQFDEVPTADSQKLVKSGGIKTALDDLSVNIEWTNVKNRPPVYPGTGTRSTKEGYNSSASGNYTHAEGNNCVASGDYSHAEGRSTSAQNQACHSEGYSSIASGNYSHAEGNNSRTAEIAAHAEGNNTRANGRYSHSEGSNTVASHRSQHVFGEHNVEDSSSEEATARGTYVEIVGNGTGSSAKSNARTLDWDGNEVLAGKLTVGADPTANMDAATKQYVDNAVSGLENVSFTDPNDDGNIVISFT